MTLSYDDNLSCIELNPPGSVSRTIIWLHGLGADGSDFVPIANELHLPANLGVRFLFPNAPIIPITINSGYEMRGWYDITSLNLQGKVDKVGIERSRIAIEKLICKEIANGIPSTHIILAGFSQGGALALTTGLRFASPLGGIMCLSGYLPLMEESIQTASPANKQVPIFMAHGTHDAIVPYIIGQSTCLLLEQFGFNTSWHAYPIEHNVCKEEVDDISQWVQAIKVG